MIKFHEASEMFHELSFRLMPLTARLLTGGTAAFAALSACYGLFGPYSDLSAIRLAADPTCTQLGEAHDSVVSSYTDRDCAPAEAARMERAASSAATMRVARAAAPSVVSMRP